MTIKFGMIGLGKIAHRFAGALQRVPGVELAAVASRDLDRSEQFASQYRAARFCADYEELMLDPEVDVVYISLVNSLHYEITRQCLEHHKPVLCEKPLVTTQREAEELVALARENLTFLMEALWTRCMPAFRRAKAWVKARRIGDVKLITANFSFLGDRAPDNRLYDAGLQGGSLFDVGVYPVDFATGILDEFPTSVSGLAHIAATGVDEAESFSLGFASGAMASLNSGFTVNARTAAVIYGTRGRIVVEDCVGPQWADCNDENGHLVEHFEEPVPDGFAYQIQHCADLLRGGKLESDLIPWADSIASAKIFDALRRQWGLLK
jgi:predicted dehydrogenase